MKSRKGMAALAALLMGSIVWAQDMGRPDPARQDPMPSELDVYQKMSDLIGKDVKNAARENLGDIKEVVLDPAHRKVRYVVVSFGGFLGLGDKLFGIPWSAFTWQGRDQDILLKVDKERFKNAPGFDKDHWPDLANPTWSTEVDRYYESHGKEGEKEPGLRTDTTGTGKNCVKFSDLKGKDILDARGEKIGEVEDAILNVTRGTVPFFVVEAKNVSGLDGELIALPLNLTTVGTDHRTSLTIARDRLARAPAFKKSQWPSLNHGYAQDVWRFYGVTHAEELGRVGAPGREGEMGRTGREGEGYRTAYEGTGKECVSMRKLLQSSVRDTNGQNLGRIRDAIADPSQGRIEFVVVDLGMDPAAGGDGKARLIPFTLVQAKPGENTFTVRTDLQKVKGAPVFEESRLDTMDREELRRQVYGHFGLSPR